MHCNTRRLLVSSADNLGTPSIELMIRSEGGHKKEMIRRRYKKGAMLAICTVACSLDFAKALPSRGGVLLVHQHHRILHHKRLSSSIISTSSGYSTSNTNIQISQISNYITMRQLLRELGQEARQIVTETLFEEMRPLIRYWVHSLIDYIRLVWPTISQWSYQIYINFILNINGLPQPYRNDMLLAMNYFPIPINITGQQNQAFTNYSATLVE